MASSTEAREEPPPSKKRVALRQISKDEPDSDDEGDNGGGAADGGTFRRASNEVLAERRIVKIRRSGGAAAPSSAPNPFAGIRLFPPTIPPVVSQETTPSLPVATTNLPNFGPSVAMPAAVAEVRAEEVSVPVTEQEQEGSFEVVQPEAAVAQDTVVAAPLVSVEDLGEHVPEGVVAGTIAVEGKTDDAAALSIGSDATNGDGEAAKGRNGGELVSSSGKSSETFEQLSSAKNAFAGAGSGAFGTGFFPSASSIANSSSGGFAFGSSQPAFSFGSSGLFTFGSSGNTPFGAGIGQGGQPPVSLGLTTTTTTTTTTGSPGGAFPSVSSVFGTSSNGTGAPPVFGGGAVSGTPTGSQAPNKPSVVSLQEVHVETGEEKEKAVFTADAVLFEFLDGNWKERGKGELKLNVSEEKDKKPRLVMRAKGNFRLLLNASLFPDMKLSKMDNRGISFVCANSAAAAGALTTYAVRLKDGVVASEFTATVQAHKGSTSSEPKTPESSPKNTERPASKEEGVTALET